MVHNFFFFWGINNLISLSFFKWVFHLPSPHKFCKITFEMMVCHSSVFLILPFSTASFSLYFFCVCSSFQIEKVLHVIHFEMFKTFLFQLISAVWFHESEYIIVSFLIFSLIAFGKVFMDQFGTRKHSSVSRQTLLKIHCCGRIHPTLSFCFLNFHSLRLSCQVFLFFVVHI